MFVCFFFISIHDLCDHIKKYQVSNASDECEYCNFKLPNTFFKTRVLIEHILKDHSKVRFVCSACFSSFHTSEDHYDHLDTDTSMFQNNKCLRCNIYVKSSCLYSHHLVCGCPKDKYPILG